MTLDEKFNAAKEKVHHLPKKPSNEVLLNLYSLNKQATVGEVNVEAPKMFDFIGAAKYNAWKSRAGMSKEEAMSQYIALVEKLIEA
ncbi:MAG: acyl-CoA-binding protein [bacterium]|nr:acyl-CoA-binding protein [bacterium]